MGEKWIKINIFTSTWNIWRQSIPLKIFYNKDLDAELEIEDIEPPEEPYPRIRFTSKPHGFTPVDGQSYELVAIVPNELKEDIIKAWKKIMSEDDPVEILKTLLDIVFEYDESPVVKTYFDEYEVRIGVNTGIED